MVTTLCSSSIVLALTHCAKLMNLICDKPRSSCPSQLWLDVYHRERLLPGAALSSLRSDSPFERAHDVMCLLAGLSPSRNKTFVDIGCNKVPHACMHACMLPVRR